MRGKLYIFKKTIVVVPFFLLFFELVKARYGYLLENEFAWSHISDILLNTIPLTIFVIIDTFKRKQSSIPLLFVQASFYVYILCVYYLTLFPLSVENGFSNTYWIRGINIVPFNIFSDYSLLERQIVGNFIMLMPLGIYIHFLYKSIAIAIKALLVLVLVSFTIEITQLIFSAGTTDIDDIILNTVGGFIAYLCFKLAISFHRKRIENSATQLFPYRKV